MKEDLEKKQCLFLHQGITIGHWFQPSHYNKIKTFLQVDTIIQKLSLKETLWERYEPKRVHSQSTSAFLVSKQDFLTGFDSFFLAADRYEIKSLLATPDSFRNSSSPHKYHNMWNCSGSTTTYTCSYMCTGTERYKYLGWLSTSQNLKLIKILYHAFPDLAKP